MHYLTDNSPSPPSPSLTSPNQTISPYTTSHWTISYLSFLTMTITPQTTSPTTQELSRVGFTQVRVRSWELSRDAVVQKFQILHLMEITLYYLSWQYMCTYLLIGVVPLECFLECFSNIWQNFNYGKNSCCNLLTNST